MENQDDSSYLLSSNTLSSVPRMRILLAPYMSPFDVPLAKIKTWEQLVVMLQRLFGPSFCSLDSPPDVTYEDNTKITQESWKDTVTEDLRIVVHSIPNVPQIKSNENDEHSHDTPSLTDDVRRQSYSPVKNRVRIVQNGMIENQNAISLENDRKSKKGLWNKVLTVVSRNRQMQRLPDENLENFPTLVKSSKKKEKKKEQARWSSQRASEQELIGQTGLVKSEPVTTSRRLSFRRRRASSPVPPFPTMFQVSAYTINPPEDVIDIPLPIHGEDKIPTISRRPSRDPPPIPSNRDETPSPCADIPTVPPRTSTPTGIQAQYMCLDENLVRAVVEEAVLLRDREHDEITLIDTNHDIPTLHKRSTSSKSVYRPVTSDGTRARRGTGSSTSTAVASRPNTSHSTRSRSNSNSAGLYRPTTPYDNKPLPKIPYKLSPFPARDTSITNPAAVTAMVKNGTLPPIATFEDLVKNTPSFSDAGSDKWVPVSSTKVKKEKCKVSSSLNDAAFSKRDWYKRPHTRGSDTGVAYQ